MTDKQELTELGARVTATEYLLKHILWYVCVIRKDIDNDEDEAIDYDLLGFSELAASVFSRSTVSNADPATCDHVAGLVSENVRRLVDELMREKRVGPYRHP